MLRILSLGAGVQSTTLALMAAKGEIKPPDCAIFADTQSEPELVMGHLWWLQAQLPYPVYIATTGDLGEHATTVRTSRKTGKRVVKSLIPAYILNPDGTRGIMGRKCTTDFKIMPIQRMTRQLLGLKQVRTKNILVEQWIGISADEAHRMKPSRVPWIKHRWPLIDLRMTRSDCLKWMEANRYPEPPRSACYFCPFHGDAEWINLRDNQPREFKKAIAFEERLSAAYSEDSGFRGQGAFLHNSLVPIGEAVLGTVKDHAQLDLWGNECEGMCGV